MRQPHRRVRTEPPAGADPSPAGGAAFLEAEELRDELPAPNPAEDRAVEFDDEASAVLDDDASLENRERLEAERPPHYA